MQTNETPDTKSSSSSLSHDSSNFISPNDQPIEAGFTSLLTAGGMIENSTDSSRRNRRDKAIAPRDGRVPTLGQMANDYRRTSPEDDVDGPHDGPHAHETKSHTPMSEATGRWTKLEHETFLKALRKYGKEWKKVAAMVHTRTVVQTRTHAQKYFQKINKSNPNEEEDENELSDGDKLSSEGSGGVWGSTVKRLKTNYSSPDGRSPPPQLKVQTNRFEDDFNTAPSPAACGKRRKEELAAAAVLIQAASPTQVKASELLSAMKKTPLMLSSPKPTDRSIDRRRPTGLRVLNPDSLKRDRSKSYDEPSTPWDSEVERLAQASSSEHDPHRRSDLHMAVLHGSISQVRHALSAMSQDDFTGSLVHLVNEPDTQGHTPLISAVALQTIEGVTDASESQVESVVLSLVLVLLEHGADPAVTDLHLNTVLHWASARGWSMVLTELLRYPACDNILNAVNQLGDSALHWASALSQLTCIKVLLEAGANSKLRNGLSQSPLDKAAVGLNSAGMTLEPLGETARVATRRAVYSGDPRCRTLVLSHKDCLGHIPKTDRAWECPERITDVMDAIVDPTGCFDPSNQEMELSSDFDKASAEFLGRAHCAEYIKFVSDLARQMKDMESSTVMPFTPQVRKHLKQEAKAVSSPCDTSFSVGSLDAARRAAGAVMTAVDRVLRGRNRNAFCVVRPPGHHAGRSGLLDNASSHGFCIFNSVAAGALHALEASEHRLSRVAIIDFDVHHGNGTEEIVRGFQSPDRLLFFSIHLYDKESEATASSSDFYPGSGGDDQTAHNIINVPLVPLWKSHTQRAVTRGRTKRENEDTQAAQSGRRAFRHGISTRLLPALRAFNPELVLLSSGFDAAASDVGNQGNNGNESSGLDLTPQDFQWITKEIQQIADMCCGGKVVSVLEGGYGCKVDMSKPGNFGVKPVRQSASEPEKPTESLDRSHLAEAACAHLRGLIDPYSKDTAEQTNKQDLT